MSKWSSLPTEQINPRTLSIDRVSSAEIVAAMSREDRRVVAAVARERPRIARGIDMLAAALARGGRVFFVGAGTSGRLGVIEAAELPPTFGTPPEAVRAVIAGGEEAVFRAREGAEDDFDAGVRALADAGVSSRDVVVGISASGITEFVRGALTAAKRARATRVFVTCWPGTGLQALVHLVIAPAVGPEVIAGSTRLKAGTATKMALNMLTTGAMIRAGKTYGNLMVDVRTGSAKLKDRAKRIVSTVTGIAPERAGDLLAAADWDVKAAIVMAKTGGSPDAARETLRRAGGLMRRALGEDLAPVLRRRLRAARRRP
ncbi:MAG: N-acetylmuramic acid 6-phosphate etherase [Acidobacteria bacterium]|nr:N-acetylmuramic acid 6-phosphate etherase [Acidobacteriota bacterium]